jgi:hypothetical protein
MPTKESTIRLKLVGSTDVTSGLQAYGRQMLSNLHALRRALKAEDENKNMLTGPDQKDALAITNTKRLAAEKQFNDTLQVAQDARDKSTWEKQRIAITDKHKFLMESLDKFAKDSPKLEEWVLKAKMQATKMAEHEITKITEKEQLSRANDTIQIEKRTNAETARLNKQSKAEDDKRMKEKGASAKANEAEVKKGEAEQAGFWLADMKQKRAAAGEMKGALSGFGGKMILGGAIGQAVGAASGNAQLGSLAGNVAAGFMFGSPAIGGLVAGIELAGVAVQGWVEHSRAAAQSTESLSGTLLSLTTTWTRLGAQIDRNPFGKAMEGEMVRGRSAATKAMQQFYELDPEMLSLGDMTRKVFGEETSKHVRQATLLREGRMHLESSEAAKVFRDDELSRQISNAKELLPLQDKVNDTALIRPSLFRERTKLARETERDNKEREDRFESQRMLALAAQVQAGERVMELQALIDEPYDKKNPDARSAHNKLYEDKFFAQMDLRDATENRKNLKPQQELERAMAASEVSKKEKELKEQTVLAKQSLFDQAEDSKIRATSIGYAREEALHKKHIERQRRDLEVENDPELMPAFEKRVAEDAAEWKAERKIRVETMAASVDVNSLRAVQQRQVGDWGAMGASEDQIKLLKNKEIRGEQVQLDIRGAVAMRDYAGAQKMAREEVEYQAKFKIHDQAQLDKYMASYDKLIAGEKKESMLGEELSLRERMAKATRNYGQALAIAEDIEKRRYEATPGVKSPEEIAKHMDDWRAEQRAARELVPKLAQEQAERQTAVLTGKMNRSVAIYQQLKAQYPELEATSPEALKALVRAQEVSRLTEQYGSPLNQWRLKKEDILRGMSEKGADGKPIIAKERGDLELRQLMGQTAGGMSTDISEYRNQLQASLNNQQLTPEEQREMHKEILGLLSYLKTGVSMKVA